MARPALTQISPLVRCSLWPPQIPRHNWQNLLYGSRRVRARPSCGAGYRARRLNFGSGSLSSSAGATSNTVAIFPTIFRLA